MGDITNDRSRIVYNNEGQAIFGGSNAVIWVNPPAGSHAGVNFRQDGTFKGFVGFNNSTSCVNLSMDGSIADGINVDASHDVGIGVTSPGHKLDVSGNIRLQGGDRKIVFNNGSVETSLDQMAGGVGGLGTLGRFGVGTTSPSDLQHNVITSNGTALHLNNTTGGSGAFVDLDFTTYTLTGTNPDAAASIRVIDNGAHGGHITFRSKASGMGASQSEIVRFEQGGNVGIGTNSPQSKLHVYNASTFSAMRLQHDNGSGSTASIVLQTDSSGIANDGFGIYDVTNAAYNLTLQRFSTGSATSSKMTIGPYVSGTKNIEAWLVGVDENHSIKFRVGANNKTYYYSYGGTGTDKGHQFYTGGTVAQQSLRLGISDDRIIALTNVGIGNTSPSQKLHVTGSILASSDVIAFSDKKLKENIKTLAGSKVYDMRGVSFTRKDTGKDSSGVIAQEIQKIAPELVTDNDGTLSVAYGNLTGYLIEAVKELKAEIEELKKQIK